jgi:nucleoside-triphosphatase THEP1
MIMGAGSHTKTEGLPALTALIYEDGPAFGRLTQRIARLLRDNGLSCAGFVQHDEECPGRSRCDMVLENLETGARIQISEDRGAEARGCRLDPNALVAAVEGVRQALGSHVEVLLLSKFGKTEAEGSGFRPLIAQALELGVPIVVGVPKRNIENWRHFAEDLAHEIPVEAIASAGDAQVLATLGVAARAGEGRA